MKIPTTKALVLLCLAMISGLVGADDRFDSRYGYPSIDRLEWRLGNSRGSIGGYEILYRASGRGRWQTAPGTAVAIGDGWVLGTDRHRGGYGIYRWSGRGWSRMPGTAVRIGGSYRQPWVINDLGIRFVWNGYDWQQDRDGRRYNDRDRRDRDNSRGGRWGADRDDDRARRDRDIDRRRDNDARYRDFR